MNGEHKQREKSYLVELTMYYSSLDRVATGFTQLTNTFKTVISVADVHPNNPVLVAIHDLLKRILRGPLYAPRTVGHETDRRQRLFRRRLI